MNPPNGTARRLLLHRLLMGAAVATMLGACAGAPSGGAATLSDAGWRALASPRAASLPGAARLSLGELAILGDPAWPSGAPVPAALGLSELVASGLLRRSDVRFVERRRFAAAVEAERAGTGRAPGAPAAGVSPGAELTASMAWVRLGAGGASLEVRLSETATGRVVQSRRAPTPADADPVALARATVAAILATLADLDRLPDWDDPIAGAAPSAQVASGVPSGAVVDFMVGLQAEEQWRWESAREAYQAAARNEGFFEAEVALARAARLRLGGTLGES